MDEHEQINRELKELNVRRRPGGQWAGSELDDLSAALEERRPVEDADFGT